jgi:hypothetical protein
MIGRGTERSIMDSPIPKRPHTHADPFSAHVPSIK